MEQVLNNLDTLKNILDELTIYETDLTSRGLYLIYEAEDIVDDVKESLTANS